MLLMYGPKKSVLCGNINAEYMRLGSIVNKVNTITSTRRN